METVSTTSVNGRDLSVSRVAQATPVASVSTAREPAADPAASAPTVARSLAQSAPINADHVALVKKAIANGTFPILPATIADRLLALKLEWNENDQA